MAQELYTRTNQKLFFAGLALESMAKAEQSQAMNARAWSRPNASRRCSISTAHCWACVMKLVASTACQLLQLSSKHWLTTP